MEICGILRLGSNETIVQSELAERKVNLAQSTHLDVGDGTVESAAPIYHSSATIHESVVV